jgi:hypothetical protein
MRALAIGTFVPTLRTLGHLFEKAEDHARTRHEVSSSESATT